MKILSIVVPTYNMEQYLSRCLDSVTCISTIDNIEVIVVNDGSTDSSSAIAHQYANKFPQSVIVIDKKNENYGSCINAALRISTGKYIRVLDADDWFDSENLELLLEKLQNVTVDAIITHYTKEFVKGNRTKYAKTTFSHFDEIIPINSNLLFDVNINKDFVMHKLMYRTDLLRNINYHQTEGISYTDTEYVYYPLMHVQNIIFYDLTLYRYYIGREGQTVSIPSRIKHADDMYVILQRIMKNTALKDNVFLNQVRLNLLTTFFASYYWSVLVIQKLTIANNENLRRMDCLLKKWDVELYTRLDSVKCLGIRYIHYWRKKKTTIIPYKVYCYLHRLFIF